MATAGPGSIQSGLNDPTYIQNAVKDYIRKQPDLLYNYISYTGDGRFQLFNIKGTTRPRTQSIVNTVHFKLTDKSTTSGSIYSIDSDDIVYTTNIGTIDKDLHLNSSPEKTPEKNKDKIKAQVLDHVLNNLIKFYNYIEYSDNGSFSLYNLPSTPQILNYNNTNPKSMVVQLLSNTSFLLDGKIIKTHMYQSPPNIINSSLIAQTKSTELINEVKKYISLPSIFNYATYFDDGGFPVSYTHLRAHET
jgi:hypothetical protein